MVELVVFAIVFLFLVVLIFRSVKIVPPSKRLVVFRLGRFHAVHNPGRAILVPFIEQGKFVDMERQTIELKPQQVSILDSTPVNMTINIGYRVIDPVKATFNVADYKSALATLSETQIRKFCGEQTLSEVLAERPKIQERIRESMNLSAQEWGIHVSDFAISFVDVSEEVQQELSRKAEAERLRRLMSDNT